jgi:hypothetical protein
MDTAHYLDLQLRVARLQGYLDAVAAMDGQYGEHSIAVTLLERDEDDWQVASLLSKNLRGWEGWHWAIDKVEPLARWSLIEREFFPHIMLSCPFDEDGLAAAPRVASRRYELAWQATDQLMFVLGDVAGDKQIPSFRIGLSEPNVVYSEGYAFMLRQALLFVHYIQHQRRAGESG